jgi:hypothetical protein
VYNSDTNGHRSTTTWAPSSWIDYSYPKSLAGLEPTKARGEWFEINDHNHTNNAHFLRLHWTWWTHRPDWWSTLKTWHYAACRSRIQVTVYWHMRNFTLWRWRFWLIFSQILFWQGLSVWKTLFLSERPWFWHAEWPDCLKELENELDHPGLCYIELIKHNNKTFLRSFFFFYIKKSFKQTNKQPTLIVNKC